MNVEIIKSNLKWRCAFKLTNKPNKVILHHALHDNCSIYDIHKWHLDRWDKEPGFGYNYFITKSGKIYEGRPHNAQGCHTQSQNNSSLSICLEGCYTDYGTMTEKSVPSAQLLSLVWLLRLLNVTYKISALRYHRDYTLAKDCPGKYFISESELGTKVALSIKLEEPKGVSVKLNGIIDLKSKISKASKFPDQWITVIEAMENIPELIKNLSGKDWEKALKDNPKIDREDDWIAAIKLMKHLGTLITKI